MIDGTLCALAARGSQMPRKFFRREKGELGKFGVDTSDDDHSSSPREASSDDDLLAVFIPFEHGARADTEPSADLRRDRDLPLCGELRLSKGHVTTLPG